MHNLYFSREKKRKGKPPQAYLKIFRFMVISRRLIVKYSVMSKQNVLSLELACRTSNVTSYATAILEQLLECIPLLWSGAEEESPFGSPLRQETVRRISLNVPQRNECLRDGYCTMVTDRRTDHGIIETFGGHVLLKTKSQFVERSSRKKQETNGHE